MDDVIVPGTISTLSVMMIGDSQTTGSNPAPGGSRNTLWRLARQAGIPLRLVGPAKEPDIRSTSDMRPWPGDPFCGAYAGETIAQLATRCAAAGTIYAYVALHGAPDCVFIMAGTNDLSAGASGATAWASMQALLAAVAAICPTSKIVVESVPLFYSPAAPTGGVAAANVAVAAFNAAMAAGVAALGPQFSYLDACAGFSRADSYTDGVHLQPNAQAERGAREFRKLVALFPGAVLSSQQVPRSFRPRTAQASATLAVVATDTIVTTADDGWRLPAGNFLGGCRMMFTGALPTTFAAIAQATQSGGSYSTGWAVSFAGNTTPKTINYYDKGGAGGVAIAAQSPVVAGQPFWLFWHGDYTKGTASLWVAMPETQLPGAPWTLQCIGAGAVAPWPQGNASAILSIGKNASFNGFAGTIDDVFYCNSGVPGFADIRPYLEDIVFDGGTAPTRSGHLPINEGTGTSCASSMGGTSGTMTGATWLAAKAVPWPSDDTIGPRTYQGAGSPESVVTAAIGSLYMRTDGGAATSLYVKESGVSNTGWIAK